MEPMAGRRFTRTGNAISVECSCGRTYIHKIFEATRGRDHANTASLAAAKQIAEYERRGYVPAHCPDCTPVADGKQTGPSYRRGNGYYMQLG